MRTLEKIDDTTARLVDTTPRESIVDIDVLIEERNRTAQYFEEFKADEIRLTAKFEDDLAALDEKIQACKDAGLKDKDERSAEKLKKILK